MNNKLQLVNIELEHVQAIMNIEQACHPHPWSEKTLISCLGDRYFAKSLIVQEKLVGFYIAEYILDESTLMNICIAPDYQGQGYGKALLLHYVKQCREKNINKLFLEVRKSNFSAQMLYIAQGFVEISRRTGYYPSNTGFGYEDAIIMSKNL